MRLSLRDALAPIAGPSAASLPEVAIALRNARILVVSDEEKTKTALFGVDLDVDATLDLSALPALAALTGGGALGLSDVGLAAASGDIPAKRLAAIRALLGPDADAALPRADSGDKTGGDKTGGGISRGVTLCGSLSLGDAHAVPLALPAGPGGDAKPAGAAAGPPSATDGAVDGATDAGAGMRKWFSVEKSLGPLHVGRVGVGFDGGAVDVLLDADVDLAGLGVGLKGFGVGIPIRPGAPGRFSLDGLQLSYRGGPIEIAGAFLRVPPDRYDGFALLKAPGVSVSGFGSYTTVDGAASIFIFAALHAHLGGPPFFDVRGLAAGFGYNRKLTLPPVEEVGRFPFVRAALDANFLGGADKTPAQVVDEALSMLSAYVTPSAGDYWVAAGVRFSSFEMIHSVALLSVSFGHEIEIGLLGLSRMSLPHEDAPEKFAVVELALRASFKPESGALIVEGRLTDASFILSKDCRLSGGFAFAVWLAGEHEGDFVVTLGGYHPDFDRGHYPAAPRLRAEWTVSRELSVTGEVYFALTPSCMMVGGRLAAVYRSGSVRAWFVAFLDFIVAWQPLRYEGHAALRIGVAVDLGLGVVSAELSVALAVWGPPFAGRVDVDLAVLSFAIVFGPQKKEKPQIDAKAFKAAFLPDPKAVVAMRLERGLSGGAGGGGGPAIVNAHELTLAIRSAVPIRRFALCTPAAVGAGEAPPLPAHAFDAPERFRIRPMDADLADSDMTATLLRRDGGGRGAADLANAAPAPIASRTPDALWASAEADAAEDDTPPVPPGPPRPRINAATTGARLSFTPRAPEGALPPMPLALLARAALKPRTWPAPAVGDEPEPIGGSLRDIAGEAAAARRAGVVRALARRYAWLADDPAPCRGLEAASEQGGERFYQAWPIVCALDAAREEASP